jgi:flagellar motor switch protein FliG
MADDTATAEPPVEEAATPGSRRAAAVLLGIGPEMAASIFSRLGEREVRRVALGARGLRSMAPGAVPEALDAFVKAMQTVGGDSVAGDDVLREVVSRALGPETARRAFDGVAPPPPPDEVLGPVSQADPESLAMVLQMEQPQTVALVLSSLEPQRALVVAGYLPAELRQGALRRMATIESVAPEILREVGQALSAELKSLVAGGMRKVDGKTTALEIMRRSSPDDQAAVLGQIEKDDPALAGELRSQLFTFSDVAHLTDRDLQVLLRDVESTKLVLALRGATTEVRTKLLRNLSSRAAEMINDDLAAMGPVKLALVEAAQGEIAKQAQDLGAQGKITILSGTEKVV